MAQPFEQLGRDCVAYYSTGTYGSPVWVAMPRVKDVDISMTKNTGTFTSRNSVWQSSKGAVKIAGATFGYLYTGATSASPDAVFEFLLASYLNNSAHDFWFPDAATAGSGENVQGWRMYGEVIEVSQSQPEEDGVTLAFEIAKRHWNDSGTIREPEWFEVDTP